MARAEHEAAERRFRNREHSINQTGTSVPIFKKESKMECANCNEKIKADPVSGWDQGNNGWPLVDGKVCSQCNILVIMERIRRDKLPKLRISSRSTMGVSAVPTKDRQ